MAKNISSADFTRGLPPAHRVWTQSVDQVLQGGVTLGQGVGKNNVGVYNEFTKDTSSGVLIRIGANGTTEQKYTWGAVNAPITINHGLLRQPIGFHVVDIDGAGQVYRTATPDQDTIMLAPTDNTKNVTLYIF
jgi:hypothetical protein